MAKIIEKGKDVDWISEEITCKSCGTIFQLEAEDILSIECGTQGAYNCPGCGIRAKRYVPQHVQNYTTERNHERYEEKNRSERSKKDILFSYLGL